MWTGSHPYGPGGTGGIWMVVGGQIQADMMLACRWCGGGAGHGLGGDGGLIVVIRYRSRNFANIYYEYYEKHFNQR